MDRNAYRTLVVGAVVAGGLMLSTSSVALAGASAVAILEVEDFVISTDTGGALIPGTNVTIVSTSNTSAASASHTSFGATGLVSTTLPTPPVNVAVQCVGPDCSGTENNFVAEGANFPSTLNFARGDGSIVFGAVGVDASTVAEVESTTAGPTTAGSSGVADSSNEFSFILGGGATGLRFDFQASQAVYASLDQDGVIANAVNEYRIQIRDATNALIFDWAPNGLVGGISGGVEVSDTQNLNNEAETLGAGVVGSFTPTAFSAFAATVSGLTQGVTYTVNISHESRVNVETDIPEPTTLALFGFGLLGLGLLVYQRRRKEEDGMMAS